MVNILALQAQHTLPNLIGTMWPNDAAIEVSDYYSILERSTKQLVFARPLFNSETDGYNNCSPGSRIRILASKTFLKFNFSYNGLVTLTGGSNSIATVFVNGIQTQTFSSDTEGTTTPSPKSTILIFETEIFRLVEIVWPRNSGLSFINLEYNTDSGIFQLPVPRPSNKFVALGDSRTHGMGASSSLTSWAYGTASDFNLQLVNMGYGGRKSIASDGAIAYTGTVSRATFQGGYNYYYNDGITQADVTAFGNEMKNILINMRVQMPSAKILAMSDFYATALPFDAAGTTLATYRTAFENAATSIGDSNLVVHSGLTMCVNSTDRLNVDGVHQSDLGQSEIRVSASTLLA